MNRGRFQHRYGPWAVVTGASAGIGRTFASELAARGLNVVLVARRETLLRELAGRLQRDHGVQTRVIAADLTDVEALHRIGRETADLDVGLLINNAGTGVFGPMLDNDLDSEVLAADLNVRAPLVLSYLFGRRLRDRGRGGLIIVSSMVGLLGVANFANYAATKAYDLTLAEGLRAELGGQIDVHALLPGFTESEYMEGYDVSAIPMPLAKPSALVRGALDRLGRGGALLVPGLLNAMSVWMMLYAPRWLNTRLFGAMVRRMKPTPGSKGLRPARAPGREPAAPQTARG